MYCGGRRLARKGGRVRVKLKNLIKKGRRKLYRVGKKKYIIIMENSFQKSGFSKEWLFKESQNHALGIRFKHSSTSYEEHGSHVVITEVHDDNNELRENMLAKPQVNTYGEITATMLNTDTFEKILITFDTNDILDVSQCK